MKKAILILSILSIGCSTEKQTCICQKALYLDNPPAGCYVEHTDVEVDCETKQPIQINPVSTFVKCLDE